MTTQPASDFVPAIAHQLGLNERGVSAVLQLFGEGATVPFIARYRKERTGGLDEVQIRTIEERATYLRELEERRGTVLASIEEQGKLTDALRAHIIGCTTKQALEDLYLPFRPKRRTKATVARERGLEPLAERILAQPDDGDPEREAAGFIAADKEVPDVPTALAGARDIVIEAVAENAEVRSLMRQTFAEAGVLRASVQSDKAQSRTKFEDYYDFHESVTQVPSHRILAVRRGETEGVLRVRVEINTEPLQPRIESMMGLQDGSPFAGEMRKAVADAISRKLCPSVETDVRVDLKMRADHDAVDVFADNLRHLLLAAPLGSKPVVGIDPGLRTGSKCVAVDATGKFLETITIYPARGEAEAQRARSDLVAFIQKHQPMAVAVGNGTGGRETEALAREVLAEATINDVVVVSVNEAGASVYSASDVAREEFPDLDLTIRGAISIARRLQDPLAELVKIDPKSIGVGQYQHDVHQPLLQRKLHEVVESCVNHVGVELNTASSSLLSYVAGIGVGLAKRIVQHRDEHGAFADRWAILQVGGMGPKTFEQAAGFLRVAQSPHPLDHSAVHPERYDLVERMASDMGVSVEHLVGNATLAGRIDISRYVDADTGIGEPTLRDIVAELKKPGRDPRAEFAPPRFRADVTKLEDLQQGMQLEGVVTNVTDFGAFVDVGVHQDGLVHISALADHFVKDPREVVKVGDRLHVRVLNVDIERGRISLSAKSETADTKGERRTRTGASRTTDDSGKSRGPRRDQRQRKGRSQFTNNPFAGLLNKRS